MGVCFDESSAEIFVFRLLRAWGSWMTEIVVWNLKPTLHPHCFRIALGVGLRLLCCRRPVGVCWSLNIAVHRDIAPLRRLEGTRRTLASERLASGGGNTSASGQVWTTDYWYEKHSHKSADKLIYLITWEDNILHTEMSYELKINEELKIDWIWRAE